MLICNIIEYFPDFISYLCQHVQQPLIIFTNTVEQLLRFIYLLLLLFFFLLSFGAATPASFLSYSLSFFSLSCHFLSPFLPFSLLDCVFSSVLLLPFSSSLLFSFFPIVIMEVIQEYSENRYYLNALSVTGRIEVKKSNYHYIVYFRAYDAICVMIVHPLTILCLTILIFVYILLLFCVADVFVVFCVVRLS